jgi:hypothetical protein
MSPCLEAFAMELAQNPEFASDHSIIHFVRLQQIFHQIDKTSSDHEVMERNTANRPRDMGAFQNTFRTFKSQLQDYANRISPLLTDNNC